MNSSGSEVLRLFLAVDLPEALRLRLFQLKQMLSRRFQVIPGFRWMEAYSWHITVLFIGEFPRSEIPLLRKKIQQVVEGFEPFTLTPLRMDWAPPHERTTGTPRFRMLWVYFQPLEILDALSLALFHSVRRIHPVLEKPRIPLLPHVTLARFSWVRVDQLPTLERLGYYEPIPVRVLVLWESRVRMRESPRRYVRLWEFPLQNDRGKVSP